MGVMTRILNRLGVTKITIANNGVEAGRELNKRNADGVGAHPIPRVIFVTAHVSDSFRQYCIDNGAEGYLPKPCSLDSVREVLRQMVGYGNRFLYTSGSKKSWNKHSHHNKSGEKRGLSLIKS